MGTLYRCLMYWIVIIIYFIVQNENTINMLPVSNNGAHINTKSLENMIDTVMFLLPEQIPLSAGVVSAIVLAVILLVGIMAVVAYLIFIRRCVTLMCIFV